MKYFFIAVLFSTQSFAQLEKPLLEGKCESKDAKVSVTFINSEFIAVIQQKRMKKTCVFRIEDANTQRGQVRTKEIFYLVPIACDGRESGKPGYEQGNISSLSFIEVAASGKAGEGNFSVFADAEALPCLYKINDWAKIRKISKEDRKN